MSATILRSDHTRKITTVRQRTKTATTRDKDEDPVEEFHQRLAFTLISRLVPSAGPSGWLNGRYTTPSCIVGSTIASSSWSPIDDDGSAGRNSGGERIGRREVDDRSWSEMVLREPCPKHHAVVVQGASGVENQRRPRRLQLGGGGHVFERLASRSEGHNGTVGSSSHSSRLQLMPA